ncbi:VWA domain-containing protein [Archangium gephyra]|uniref:VWA domain-containing protein n=1 Tax=Archangium gephyra TaxID=48 RepID=UPI0035D4A947
MRYLSRCLPLQVLLLLAWGPGTALAEEPSPCEELKASEDRGHEVEHRVEARPEGDLVHFTVHRTFHNPGTRYTELEALLELPREGTVHGVALEAQGQWTEGLLLESSQAERRYEALRRKGTATPRALALLSAAGAGARLLLWNLPPRSPVTVHYEVRARLAYAHGRRSFTYPLPECEQAPRPVLTVLPPSPNTDFRIETRHATPWRPELEASWEAGSSRGLDARAGLAPWGAGTLGFLQVRTKRLSEAPVRARVVFVVDASHSVGPRGISRQLALAGEYLRLLPDATAEVVVFRRSAERLFGRLIPASEWKTALAPLPAARLAPGNGSHLDEGLKLAQQVLGEGSGPVRLIAFTDGRLRRTYAPLPADSTTSAPDAAVHLRWLSSHRTGDATPHEKLSGPLVRESCGLQLPSYVSSLEPLVRPLRWEQVHLQDGQGARLKELPALQEGEGFQLWLPSPQTPLSQLVLHGQRWGCAASAPVEVDPSLSADLGRNAWATLRVEPWNSNEEELPPTKAVELLAKNGDWLSDTRSFLAVPSDAGPSTARTHALPDGVTGGVAGGVVGGTILCPLAPPRPCELPPEHQEALEQVLQSPFSACLEDGAPPSLQVRLEATGEEIVDVEVTGAASEAQASCVREATWALRLPTFCDDGSVTDYTVKPGH